MYTTTNLPIFPAAKWLKTVDTKQKVPPTKRQPASNFFLLKRSMVNAQIK